MSKNRWTTAQRQLCRNDAVLARLIRQIGPCTLEPGGEPFPTIAMAIVGQLISASAARTVFARLQNLVGETGLTPQNLLAQEIDDLRSVGLSSAKVACLREVASRAVDGRLPLDRFDEMDDADLFTALTDITGIGPWTANMVLMFHLGRPNVLPVGDFGLRAGVRDLYGLEGLPSVSQLTQVAEPWQPWRSIATWYIWRGRGYVPRSGLDE
ncbi:MAG: DNA-3-methyladenine glycosylase 2 family protein [Gemmataceae bacterium]